MSVETEVIFDKLKKYGKLGTEDNSSKNVIMDCDSGNALVENEPQIMATEKNFEMEELINNVRGNLAALKENEINTSVRDFGMVRGIRGRLSWLVKKIVRRLSFFYVQPICNQQTAYNTAATQCVEHLLDLEVDLSNRIIELQKEKQSMQEELRQANAALQEELHQRNAALQEELHQKNAALQEELHQINGILQQELAMVNTKSDQYMANMKMIEETGICKFLNASDHGLKKSYAQSGEDSIILYIFAMLGINIQKSTYLDLGANHAKELSNTFMLYEKGMRGVLLEANPALIPELKLNRNEDIVVNKCLAVKSNEPVVFYVLSGDGLSTADREAVDEVMVKNPDITIVNEVKIETITIQELLDKYFAEAPTVLNVDLEGMELDILRGIDFTKVRPLIIIVEMIEYSMMLNAGKKNQEILTFMEQNNYIEYAFTGINSIFVDASVWEHVNR